MFQVSLMAALLDGVYDGDATVGQLLDRGDFGLGTFNALDGEMIILDSVVHRLRSGGEATPVGPEEPTPFAIVTRFVPSITVDVPGGAGRDEVAGMVDRLVSTNYLYAMRITGRFAAVEDPRRGQAGEALPAPGRGHQGRADPGARPTSTASSPGSAPRSTSRGSGFPAGTSTSSTPTGGAAATSSTSSSPPGRWSCAWARTSTWPCRCRTPSPMPASLPTTSAPRSSRPSATGRRTGRPAWVAWDDGERERALARRVQVSAEDARRFLVARQMLAPPRSLAGGPEAVLEVARRLGSIQFDPLAVAGRNHDLVLHARVAGYDPAWTDDLLYERRRLVEVYSKGLSIVPTSDYPWFRAALRVGAEKILGGHPEVADHVLARITGGGPLSTLDFERPAGVVGRLVRGADEHGAGRAGGVLRHRRARSRPTGREPPLLRPDRATPARRDPGAHDPSERADAPPAAVSVPRPRSLGHQRRRGYLRQPRPGEAGPELARVPGSDRTARGARRRRRARPRHRRGCPRQAVRPPR